MALFPGIFDGLTSYLRLPADPTCCAPPSRQRSPPCAPQTRPSALFLLRLARRSEVTGRRVPALRRCVVQSVAAPGGAPAAMNGRRCVYRGRVGRRRSARRRCYLPRDAALPARRKRMAITVGAAPLARTPPRRLGSGRAAAAASAESRTPGD